MPTRDARLDRRHLAITGGAVFLLLAALWFAYLGSYVVDDSWIVYRYVRNLAVGEGFVFNAGERVEGVTCFLWTLLLVPLAWLPAPLPVLVPFASGLAGLAVLALRPGFAARLDGRSSPDLLDWCVPLLVASYPGFAFWSASALETVPYALLLLLSFRSYARERETGRGVASALFAGLAALTRPEVPLLVVAIIADILISQRRPRLRRAARWVGAFATVFVPFLIFRLVYFQDWLPNTFYAKTGAPLEVTLRAGALYTAAFLGSLVPGPRAVGQLLWAAGLGLAALLLVHGVRRPPLRPLAFLLALLGLAILYNGGDWMVLWRFWIPGLPFVYLLLASLLRHGLGGLPRGRAAAIGVCALLSLHAFWWGLEERRDPAGRLFPRRPDAESYGRAALYLREHTAEGDTIALMDIGQIGYQTGLRIIDITGLVTPWVAKSPGGMLSKRYPVLRLLAEQPRFFVLRPGYPIDSRIVSHRGFQRHYRRVLVVPLYRSDALHLFERTPG